METEAAREAEERASTTAAAAQGAGSEAENAELRAQLVALADRHQDEIRRQTQVVREEVEYLKQKIDEKDRRLEVLICERNALRFEGGQGNALASPEKPPRKSPARPVADAVQDLEEGLPGIAQAAPGDDDSFRGKMKVCAAETDVLLRRFTRLLFVSPLSRRVFYGYVALLHAWIWVVLHHTAAHHSGTHGGGAP